MLLKHPPVVGEKQLEAEPEREDEGQPQQRAENQRRKHRLALSAERHVEAARKGVKETNGVSDLQRTRHKLFQRFHFFPTAGKQR